MKVAAGPKSARVSFSSYLTSRRLPAFVVHRLCRRERLLASSKSLQPNLRQFVAAGGNRELLPRLLHLAVVGDGDLALAILLRNAPKRVPVLVVRLVQIELIHAAKQQVASLFGLARLCVEAG